MATTSEDEQASTMRLWDVSGPRHPRELDTLTSNGAAFSTVAFSPDGHTLVTGGCDRTATRQLWDVSEPRHPRELVTLLGDATDCVILAAFSPDGRTLATGSSNKDKTAQLWDISDTHHPHELATLTGHTDYVTSVAFSPNSHTLATSSADHTVRLWDTDPERVATHICDITNSPITPTEWNQYFAGLDYNPPCPLRQDNALRTS